MFQIFNNIKPNKKLPNEDQFREGFAVHIPEKSLDYVMSLWREYPFSFTVAGSRKSCLGNYRFKNGQHYISVNGDSNRYSFLITLIHEIAHQRVRIAQKPLKKRPMPHGKEWKYHFKVLMSPLLVPEVFPEDILTVLMSHMKNPAASSTKDPALVRALEEYSSHSNKQGVYLSDIENGVIFTFNKREFKKINDRRTRALVECTQTKKKYTIPGVAKVEVA